MEIKIEKIFGTTKNEHCIKVEGIKIGILHRYDGKWQIQFDDMYCYDLQELEEIIATVRDFSLT
jgi:hypothetical protein